MSNKLAWNFHGTFLQSLIATIQTNRNAQIMDQIEGSREDIKNGRVRNAMKFLKELYSDFRDIR